MKILKLFDIDDTLFVSSALQYVIENKTNTIKCAITSNQHIKLRELINKLKQKNIITINYYEYKDNKKSYELLKNGEKIIKYINNLIEAFNNPKYDIGIVTARGNNPKQIQELFQELYNINIPLNMIKCMNWEKKRPSILESQKELTNRLLQKYNKKLEYNFLLEAKRNQEKKKLAIFNFIDIGYRTIYFYDDDIKNTSSVKTLNKLKNINSKYQNLNLNIIKINEIETNIYRKKINRPEFKNFTYPDGLICKKFIQEFSK